MKTFRRALVAATLAALVVGVALFGVAFAARWHDGPIGPFPGGSLVAGEVVSTPVTDWSFAAPLQTLELEVNPDQPRAITTWFLIVDGVLYVPSGDGASKTWTHQVVQDGRVRARIDGKIYELQATRVTDRELGKRLSAAVHEKYGFGDGQPVEGGWAFALAPRS